MRSALTPSADTAPLAQKRGGVTRAHRRAWLQGMTAAALHGLSRAVLAADVSVPVALQCSLIGKIAAFDRSFVQRSGRAARLIIVHKDGDSARVGRQMATALEQMRDIAGLSKTVETLAWSTPAAIATAVHARPTALVYFSLDFEAEAPAIAAALAGAETLSVGATGAIAERGACVGFELEEGKPKIYVNLRSAKAQKVDFRAELLRLVKLV